MESHVKTETGIGVTLPQTKAHEATENWKGQENLPWGLQVAHDSVDTLILGF